MNDDHAKRKPTKEEMETVHSVQHIFETNEKFESEALETYGNMLKGLQVSESDSKKFLNAFRNTFQEVANAQGTYEPFMRCITQIRNIAQEAVEENRLTQMSALLAVQVPWAILCQKAGCTWCISNGYGRLDDLLVGCIPGWKCFYIKMPQGFC